eukprot:CAMPEP_0172628586 /NCGR_PEP_ID=MMETSP1068-20121228/162753_1 /TAXON_ID=35684 /ORGANISM="Pseudopedinella elastica, Strain CCMP716" /LENGTH=629 /DNA_ID=CAMNT_0013438847 /DNA_START=143 /DNA_END=2031 /DNA_ORIENTATION=-
MQKEKAKRNSDLQGGEGHSFNPSHFRGGGGADTKALGANAPAPLFIDDDSFSNTGQDQKEGHDGFFAPLAPVQYDIGRMAVSPYSAKSAKDEPPPKQAAPAPSKKKDKAEAAPARPADYRQWPQTPAPTSKVKAPVKVKARASRRKSANRGPANLGHAVPEKDFVPWDPRIGAPKEPDPETTKTKPAKPKKVLTLIEKRKLEAEGGRRGRARNLIERRKQEELRRQQEGEVKMKVKLGTSLDGFSPEEYEALLKKEASSAPIMESEAWATETEPDIDEEVGLLDWSGDEVDDPFIGTLKKKQAQKKQKKAMKQQKSKQKQKQKQANDGKGGMEQQQQQGQSGEKKKGGFCGFGPSTFCCFCCCLVIAFYVIIQGVMTSLTYSQGLLGAGFPSPTPVPTSWAYCRDFDNEALAEMGHKCDFLAHRGECVDQLCPTCPYAYYCDRSCSLCPTAAPTEAAYLGALAKPDAVPESRAHLLAANPGAHLTAALGPTDATAHAPAHPGAGVRANGQAITGTIDSAHLNPDAAAHGPAHPGAGICADPSAFVQPYFAPVAASEPIPDGAPDASAVDIPDADPRIGANSGLLGPRRKAYGVDIEAMLALGVAWALRSGVLPDVPLRAFVRPLMRVLF